MLARTLPTGMLVRSLCHPWRTLTATLPRNACLPRAPTPHLQVLVRRAPQAAPCLCAVPQAWLGVAQQRAVRWAVAAAARAAPLQARMTRRWCWWPLLRRWCRQAGPWGLWGAHVLWGAYGMLLQGVRAAR
jgi:hypothetical protein